MSVLVRRDRIIVKGMANTVGRPKTLIRQEKRLWEEMTNGGKNTLKVNINVLFLLFSSTWEYVPWELIPRKHGHLKLGAMSCQTHISDTILLFSMYFLKLFVCQCVALCTFWRVCVVGCAWVLLLLYCCDGMEVTWLPPMKAPYEVMGGFW